MSRQQILEVVMTSDEHRLLSVSSEAWWLVQREVLLPLESFLTDDSCAALAARLKGRDDSWFLTAFTREPEALYLTRARFSDDSSRITVTFAPVDPLIDSGLQADTAEKTFEALLSLHEDLYYVFQKESDQVFFFHQRHTLYPDQPLSMQAFMALLREKCAPEALPQLESVFLYFENGTPRFRVLIPSNLYNEDAAIQAVQFSGLLIHPGNGQDRVVGMIHPLRARGQEEHEVAYDPLTGVLSREHITRIAEDQIDRKGVQGSALAIVDVDYFKHVNDRFGHQHGDDLLRQLAELIEKEVRDAGIVGRIGGDEFLILFYHLAEETDLRACLRSIKSMVNATVPGTTVSIGAAMYPTAAASYSDLFLVADYCLYLAKEKGRNRYIIHTLEKHPPLEEIQALQSSGSRGLVYGRDDLPLGDVLVQLQYLVHYGKRPAVETMLQEFSQRANIPFMTLWRTRDRKLLGVGGKRSQDHTAFDAFFADHSPDELVIPRNTRDGMTVTHTVDKQGEGFEELRAALLKHGIQSYIHIPFRDASGEAMALVFGSVGRKVFWNEEHLKYYRLFADMLALCHLAE